MSTEKTKYTAFFSFLFLFQTDAPTAAFGRRLIFAFTYKRGFAAASSLAGEKKEDAILSSMLMGKTVKPPDPLRG